MTSSDAGATAATDGRDDPIRRPNPLRWIAYAYGARLPAPACDAAGAAPA